MLLKSRHLRATSSSLRGVEKSKVGSLSTTSPRSLVIVSVYSPAERSSRASPVPSRQQRLCTIITRASVASDIQIDKESISATQRKVKATIPASMCKECFTKTVDNLKQVVGDVPGFRKDKIPLSMIVTQVGGQRQFKITCIEEILMTCMPLIMEQVGEPLVNESERISSNINDLERSFDPAKPFTFEVEYETTPPIVWRKSYKETTVTLQDNGNFSTDVAATEDLINGWRKQKGGFQRVVVGRGLERGDTCIMDLDIKAAGSKVSLPGMKKQRFPFDTDMDPLGLVQGMLGMKTGDEKTFQITFPADYDIELWQGMTSDVTVKVHELFNWSLPNLDDEWVKESFSGQFATVEEMRKGLLTTTAMERVKDLDKQLEDKLLDVIVDCLDMPEVPEKMVMDMGQSQYRNNLMGMLNKKMASKDDLEKLLTEDLIEEYLAKNRKDIIDLVKFNLVVDSIFDSEGLKLDEDDIKNELELQKSQYGVQELEYDVAMLREQVESSFKHVKVIEHLKDVVPRVVEPFKA